MERRKVAVVGAGIAGLSAAFELEKAGFDVVVLERESIPGGRMAETRVDGLHVHTGASILFTFYRDMLELIRELDLERNIEYLPHQEVWLTTNGRIEYPVSLHPSPWFLLRHPALSVRSRLRLASVLPDLWSARRRTDPNLAHTAAYLDDESTSEYLRRKVGRDFLENYVEPLFRAPWNWEPERLSKGYLLSCLAHLMGRRTFSFDQGIGLLTRTLAARLEVRLGTTVTRVRRSTEAGGRTLSYHDASGGGELQVDLVVCAVPGSRVRGLIEDLAPEDAAFFEAVRYTPCGIVSWIVKSAPEAYSRWFTRDHASRLSWYGQLPGDPDAPGRPPFVFAVASPELSAEVVAKGSQQELPGILREEVLGFYPRLDQELVHVVTQWWDDMLPEFYPGYLRKLAAFLTRPREARSDLYLCGDYLAHAHAGGACASGRRAAQLAIREWSSSASPR